MKKSLGIRWTIGDVDERGFQALALSIRGAQALFGDAADYVVCVNTTTVAAARHRLGPVAARVAWRQAGTGDIPGWLAERYLKPGMAQGVAWKFAPVRLFSDRHELSLDNDVILWDIPDAVERWLEERDSLLIAEDVRTCLGAFQDRCPPDPRNSGIRGLPPGYDAERRFQQLLREFPVPLHSETDEQGLQALMVSREKHHVVTLADVTICGYFRPHLLHLGRCGAHFVGVNSRKMPWSWNGRSGEEYVHGFWDGIYPDVTARVRDAEAESERMTA